MAQTRSTSTEYLMFNYNYFSPARIKAVLATHEAAARKRWGQNFLVDPNHARLIAAQVITSVGELEESEKEVIEIGPGLGALTHLLLAEGFSVRGLEIDPVLVKILREELGRVYPNLEIVAGDAREYLESGPDAIYLCGNLPYYISTELLVATVKLPRIRGATYLTQLEFAERIGADGSNSSLGVFLSNFGKWRIVRKVGAGAFYPRPDVASALLQFQSHVSGPRCNPQLLEQLLRISFGARRKQLGNSWKKARHQFWPLEKLLELAERLQIKTTQRAEELTPEQFYSFVDELERSGESSE